MEGETEVTEEEEFEFRHRLEKENGTAPDPTEGMSTFDKVAAGAGKALTDLGRGAKQLVGLSSPKDVDEARALDAPLMATGAGKAGYIGGGLVPLAALSVIPGANTIAGSAALGAATGALEPVGTGESRLTNTAIGGGVGGGAAATLKALGMGASKFLNSTETKLAGDASRNSVRDATLKAAQAEGYITPPSAAGGGGLSKTLESIGGKAATAQEAVIRNQEVTNKIARREAGLAVDEAISEKNLKAAREVISAPYREVSALSPRAKTALEEVQKAREEAKLSWKEYGATQKKDVLKEAQRFDAKADAYEKLIDSEAKRLGRPELLQELQAARVKLAKNYDVERALNIGSGDVDAHVLGRMLDKRGEAAMSGGLGTIAKFAENFGRFSREASGMERPGTSKLAPYGSIALGAIGGAASEHYTHTPYGAAAAALPLLSGPARSIALSKIMRPSPSYVPGMGLRITDAAANDPRLKGAIPLSAVSSVLQSQQQ